MTHLTVILPTYNRLDRLQKVLAALASQTYPDFEIIVVSDGSTDGTDAYLQKLVSSEQWAVHSDSFSIPHSPFSIPHSSLPLHPLFQPNQGVAATRNHGLREATGELVLFIDDDVVPTPTLIAEHVAWHEQHGPDVIVMGPMLTPADFAMKPWVQWEQAMLMKQYDDMAAGRWQPTARQFYTGNTSLRRAHLETVGGFDPAFRRAEDVELAYRLADRGLRFLFNPNAIGYHFAERSFPSWLATPYAYGRNDVIFTRDKGQRWLLPTIAYEFRTSRHPLIRALTRLCLDRPWISQMVMGVSRFAATIGHRLNIRQLPRLGYSVIFNLRHYQGISDELRGREQFFALIQQSQVEGKPPAVVGT